MIANEQRVGEMVAEGGSQLAEVERIAGEVADDAQGVEADKGATHGYMARAETAANGAEDSAGASAAQERRKQSTPISLGWSCPWTSKWHAKPVRGHGRERHRHRAK